jgi:hypothetical protein
MKSSPEVSARRKSLAAVIVIGLVGIGLLTFLATFGLPGLRDTRTGSVQGQSIVGKTGSD